MFKMLGALFLGGFFLLIYLSSNTKMIPAGTDISTISLVLIFGGLGLIAVGNLLDGALPKRSRAPRYNNSFMGRSSNRGGVIPTSLRSQSPMSRQMPTQQPMDPGEYGGQGTQYRR